MMGYYCTHTSLLSRNGCCTAGLQLCGGATAARCVLQHRGDSTKMLKAGQLLPHRDTHCQACENTLLYSATVRNHAPPRLPHLL